MCLKSSKHGRRLAGINRQLYMSIWTHINSGSRDSLYQRNIEALLLCTEIELKEPMPS